MKDLLQLVHLLSAGLYGKHGLWISAAANCLIHEVNLIQLVSGRKMTSGAKTIICKAISPQPDASSSL